MVVIDLDDALAVTYESGDDSPVAVEIRHDDELVEAWETGSRPWDEGLLQVRNVIAAHVDGYDRRGVDALLDDAVPAREADLRALFEE